MNTISSPILNLIANGEHQLQDFKMRIDDSKKIAKTICAFANTDGGRILIGVKDNGNIFGIDFQEEAHMIEAAAEIYSKPRIEFDLIPHKVEGKNILEVWIQNSKNKPHFAQDENGEWICYLRQNDQVLPAKGLILAIWSNKKTMRPSVYEHSEKEKAIFQVLESNPKSPVNSIQKKTKLNRTFLFKTLAKLISWDIISYEMSNGKIFLSLK